MAVRMRLRREGKKKQPFYRVVVADVRSPRDGRFIEDIGYYQPLADPSAISIDRERALHWLAKGVQPSDAVLKLLRIEGIWEEFKPGDPGKDRSAKNAERARKAAEQAKAQKQQQKDQGEADEKAVPDQADAPPAEGESDPAEAPPEEPAAEATETNEQADEPESNADDQDDQQKTASDDDKEA